MKEAKLRFFSSFISIDTRSLALFRIVFGIVCVVDLFRRWPWIEIFYTNNGLWSNHFALFAGGGNPTFSLMWALSTLAQANTFFVFTLISLIFFIVGFRTKFFQIISTICFVSIINRNPGLIYGGDSVIIALMFWTLFMPLGAKWSFDSVNSTRKEELYVSLSVLGLYLQIAAIYLLSALQKIGITWREGSSIHYLLEQDRLVTPIGEFVRSHLSDSVSQFLTWGTIWIEYLIPILIFAPIANTVCRKVAVFIIIFFHLTIALVVNVGVFSFVMIAASTLLVPFKMESNFSKNRFNFLSECLAIFLLVIAAQDVIASNQFFRDRFSLKLSDPIFRFVNYTSFRQGWGMFSPSVTTEDVRLVFDLELKDGTHVDPRTGMAPSFEANPSKFLPRNHLWDVYTAKLIYDLNSPFQFELKQWLMFRQKGVEVESWGEFKAAKIWALKEFIPPLGNTSENREIRKELLLSIP